MRKTKRKSVAPAPVDAAWQAFFESQKLDDVDRLRADGWKTVEEILCSIGGSEACRQRIDLAAKRGQLEKIQANIISGNKRRKINFYRPKVS